MRWQKRGLIFEPRGQRDWVTSHAAVPFAFPIGDNKFRVYFSGRNKENKSQGGFIVIDIRRPDRIEYLSPRAILTLGRPGLFDDSGAFPSWLEKQGRMVYMYYAGWMRGVSVPYYSADGLAISIDGGLTFSKYSEAPILERTAVDPYINATCCVLKEGSRWKMWYLSAVDFRILNGRSMYYYVIKYAESSDGITWKREGRTAIGFKHRGETRISRPSVMKENGVYKMWYSYATDTYRIGYAESTNGLDWVRKDGQGLEPSEDGWDSEMVCYPHVFNHAGKKYMLYNGNSYGKTGIGYATMEEY